MSPAAPQLGIIGGGQLARMTHQAAITLGVEVTVLCADPDAPAVRAGARHLPGRPDRFEDLERLAALVDAVTLDHEQTPPELLSRLRSHGTSVVDGTTAALGSDKARAREVLEAHGVPTAPWVRATDSAQIDAFARRHGWPLVLKRPTGGYDGRGVWLAADLAEARSVLADVGEVLVEPLIDFRHELAVVVVRSTTGETAAYPAVETRQRSGRCHEAFAPVTAPVQARALAVAVAEAVDLIGAMAVELFATDRGLLLNELAVRPHNSGHLTIEACPTSQFENHVRAVLGLPLGATDLRVPAACMVNVVGRDDGGDPFDALDAALAVPGATVHRYGKDARPGRKVGHVTATADDLEAARSLAHRAARALAGVEVPA